MLKKVNPGISLLGKAFLSVIPLFFPKTYLFIYWKIMPLQPDNENIFFFFFLLALGTNFFFFDAVILYPEILEKLPCYLLVVVL